MANERSYTLRNVGTPDVPVWEIWFAITVADAVMMSDKDGETKTIVDYVDEKIADLIGGAPATFDTLKEIADYITEHKDVSDALNAAIANKADKTLASTNANGLMSKEDYTKLKGVDPGANNYVHPTASGSKHIPSGGASGQVLKWSADGTAAWGEDKDTTYGVASSSADGLMAKADKTKLDGIATGANKYVHPTAAGNKHIPAGGSAGQILRWSADGTATWGADKDTTYNAATQTVNGLMSKEDKAKLDNMPTIGFGSSYPTSAPANSIFILTKS